MIYAQALVLLGLLAGALGLYRLYRGTRRRALPEDRSPMKGDPARGIAYAFTTGMMPWAKESTRIHLVAYLRGIGFHLGIFAALGALLASPFWSRLPAWLMDTLGVAMAAGALLGAAGAILRLLERNLRGLSSPDDHFAVWLVSAFMAAGAAAVWNADWMIPFYVVSAVVLAYVPLGKIRHCLYYFFSRIFFGRFFGRRAVFPHPGAVD